MYVWPKSVDQSNVAMPDSVTVTGAVEPPPLWSLKLLQSHAFCFRPLIVCWPLLSAPSPRSPGVGNELVPTTTCSERQSVAAQRIGRCAGHHVAPSSIETSVKISKKLLTRCPPGTVRTDVRPVDARVGLSRMRSGCPGGRPLSERESISVS